MRLVGLQTSPDDVESVSSWGRNNDLNRLWQDIPPQHCAGFDWGRAHGQLIFRGGLSIASCFLSAVLEKRYTIDEALRQRSK